MPKEFTAQETCLAMLVEAKNNLTRAQVIDRLIARKKLAGKLQTADLNLDGNNRHQIAVLNETIEHLDAIHRSLVDGVEAESMLIT